MTGARVRVDWTVAGWEMSAETPAGQRTYLFDGGPDHSWTVGPEAVAQAMQSDPLLVIAIIENDQETLYHRADLWADAFEWYDLGPDSVSVTPGSGYAR